MPGEVETATLTIRNLGAVVDEVTLTIEGEAAPWTRVAPSSLNLFPSTEGQAVIRFAPPRAPRPPAGLVEVVIYVSAKQQVDASLLYRASLELGAFDQVTATPAGSTYISGGRDANLPIKVRNLGNRRTNVYVSAAELPGATVSLSSTAFGLEPGAETTVWATVKPKAQSLSGPSQVHPFTVMVSGDYSPPITVDGRFEQVARIKRPRLGRLALIAAALLLAAGTAAAFTSGLVTMPDLSGILFGRATPTVQQTGQPTGEIATGEPTAPPDGPTDEPPTAEPQEPHTDEPPTEEPQTEEPTPTPYSLPGWVKIDSDIAFSQAPAVASMQSGRIDLFAPDHDGQLWHTSGDGVNWDPWHPITTSEGAEGTSPTMFKPAAVASDANRIDVFAIHDDRQMWQLTYGSDGIWTDWQLVGPGEFTAGPGVASWAPGRLDVFGRGTDRLLYHNSFDGAWNLWEPWGSGAIDRAPAAVAYQTASGPAVVFIFAGRPETRGIDQLTYGVEFGLVDYIPLGGVFTSAPAVASWGRDRLDVFGRGGDDTLYQNTWNGATWSGWLQVSTAAIGSAPAAVSWGPERIDVFTQGDDDGIYHRWYENGVWSP